MGALKRAGGGVSNALRCAKCAVVLSQRAVVDAKTLLARWVRSLGQIGNQVSVSGLEALRRIEIAANGRGKDVPVVGCRQGLVARVQPRVAWLDSDLLQAIGLKSTGPIELGSVFRGG